MGPPKCVVDSQNLIASVYSRSLYLTYYQNFIYFPPGSQLAEAQREKTAGRVKEDTFLPFFHAPFFSLGNDWTFGRGFSI